MYSIGEKTEPTSGTARDAASRPVDLIIPLYRNPELVEPLFRSLAGTGDELARIQCSVIAVNDSPDDEELRIRLKDAAEALSLSAGVSCQIVENESNLGFVRSVNRAAAEAVKRGHDVLLLNSDTLIFPGALAEVQRVAYLDPMIGFVSPRSNNATICTFPHQIEFQKLEPRESYEIFQELSPYLPRFHFVPTAVGFCLFIKAEVLQEFGLLDESYGKGYNEENDLIMRANRCGYRAALANHAFVYHFGERSFSASSIPKQIHEEKNAALLNKRYPEYATSVRRYFDSSHYECEGLLTALLKDREGRLDLVFDFSSVGPYYNGTYEASKEILIRAVRTWKQFNLYVMASDEAIRFHQLDELERLFFVPVSSTRKFALALRFGQPFDYEQVYRMSRMAVLNVYGMLDPIAFDCQYLSSTDLERIWASVFAHGDGVIYISDFVGETFRRRFRLRPGLRELVAYLSLDYRDYAAPGGAEPTDEGYILVVGNAFAHKRVPSTVEALNRALPREKIVALGLQENRQNVIGLTSGNLSEKQMDQMLRGARVVVFPSLYEGFGIPVIKSLAYRKPVLVRSIPVVRAIHEKIGRDPNLMLYSSTDELIRILKQGFPVWQETSSHGNAEAGWDAVARQIGDFLQEVAGAVSFNDVLVPRMEHIGSPDDEARRGLEYLNLMIKDRETQIQKIYDSFSWRLTAPVRLLADVFLRMKAGGGHRDAKD